MLPLLLTTCLLAPPDLVRVDPSDPGAEVTAASLDALLADGVRAVQTVEHAGAQAVLLGRVDRAGKTAIVGLAIVRKGANGVTLAAATALPYTADWDVAFGPPLDLDGDGKTELAIDERLGGDGPALHATGFWRFDRDRLSRLHYVTRRYAWRGRSEGRTLEIGPAGRVVEVVTVEEGGVAWKTRITYAFDVGMNRLTAVQFSPLP